MSVETLDAATSGFVLATAVTVLANTALACFKDAYIPLRAVMTSIAGHDWTTQGLFDLALFIALGLFFTHTRIAARINPRHLIAGLIGAVVISSLGLVLWYAFT
jgi:hypothetical protein